MKQTMHDKQQHYKAIYEKVVVTYLDNSTKEFKPGQWALFENDIKKMQLLGIEYFKK